MCPKWSLMSLTSARDCLDLFLAAMKSWMSKRQESCLASTLHGNNLWLYDAVWLTCWSQKNVSFSHPFSTVRRRFLIWAHGRLTAHYWCLHQALLPWLNLAIFKVLKVNEVFQVRGFLICWKTAHFLGNFGKALPISAAWRNPWNKMWTSGEVGQEWSKHYCTLAVPKNRWDQLGSMIWWLWLFIPPNFGPIGP